MSTPFSENSPLNPSLIAAKVARIRNFEDEALADEVAAEPRLLAILWFLQHVSQPDNYPGGLRKFTADLIADSRDLIGTVAMQKHPEEDIDEAGLVEIHDGLPRGTSWDCFKIERFAPEELSVRDLLDDCDDPAAQCGGALLREQREAPSPPRKKCAPVRMKRELLVAACCEEAAPDLATYLRALAEQMPYSFRRYHGGGLFFDRRRANGTQAPWYFVNISDALLRFMDRHTARIAATIASTEVSRLVFHWLHKARVTRSAVIIEGSSRFGKTEAARAWALMHPGLARFVETPPNGAEGDLLRAVAAALGIGDANRLRTHRLRADIEYVLKHSGLMLVFDESQYLFPASFGRNTAPARLNWVRCHVLNAGLPAAFIATPQSYRSAERKYVKATGYAMEQWSERILKTVSLPDEVSREDLFAIARIHFPGLAENYLQYVVERAHGTERNYVSDVSKIARLTYSNAADAGLSKPKLDHIIAAINDVLPAAPAPVQDGPSRAAAGPIAEPVSARLQSPCKRSKAPLQSRRFEPDLAPFNRTVAADSETLLSG